MEKDREKTEGVRDKTIREMTTALAKVEEEVKNFEEKSKTTLDRMNDRMNRELDKAEEKSERMFEKFEKSRKGHLEEWIIMESKGSSRVDSYRS